MQVALLELLSQTEGSTENGNALDPELWSHLAPAIEYCLGAAPAGTQSADEVIRSLQVATELMRGPRRFHSSSIRWISETAPCSRAGSCSAWKAQWMSVPG